MGSGDASAWSLQGFHRYSTDQHWHVPHFEKMLYDQGQLAAAYSRAFQVRPPCPSVGCAQHPEFSLRLVGLGREQLQGWCPDIAHLGAPVLPFIHCSSSRRERCTSP